MIKRILGLTLLIVLVMSITGYADESINLNINGTKVEFTKALPFIDENGRTLVPFRTVLEVFGATVDWDNKNNTAIAIKGDIVVKIPIGENYIIKNNEKIKIDTKAINKNGSIYLPIRAVLEAFNATLNWNANTKTVEITTSNINSETISSCKISSREYKELNATNKILNENIEYTKSEENVYIPIHKKDDLDSKNLLGTCDEQKYEAFGIKLCLPQKSESISTPHSHAVVITNENIPIQLSICNPTDMDENGYAFEEYLEFELGRIEGCPEIKTDFYKNSLLEMYNQDVILNDNTITTIKIGRIIHSTSPEIHIQYIIRANGKCYELSITADSKYSQLVKNILGSYQIEDLLGEGSYTAILDRDDLLELPEF